MNNDLNSSTMIERVCIYHIIELESGFESSVNVPIASTLTSVKILVSELTDYLLALKHEMLSKTMHLTIRRLVRDYRWWVV